MSKEQNDIGFICPSCDSKKYSMHGFIDRSNFQPLAFLSDNPWVAVLEAIICASCHKTIPGHLACRYGEISFEQAKKEWEKSYKNYVANIKLKEIYRGNT